MQMSTEYHFVDDEERRCFESAPLHVVISLDDNTEIFLSESNLTLNSQQYNEVVRQCFDMIDYNFIDYQNKLQALPRFDLLLNHQTYLDSWGNVNQAGANLKKALFQFGIAIYMSVQYYGLFRNGRTPYILETVKGNACLLRNSLSKTTGNNHGI